MDKWVFCDELLRLPIPVLIDKKFDLKPNQAFPGGLAIQV